MYRKVQNEWWLTPHIVYTLTDDYDNVINGSVTVREPIAPSELRLTGSPKMLVDGSIHSTSASSTSEFHSQSWTGTTGSGTLMASFPGLFRCTGTTARMPF